MIIGMRLFLLFILIFLGHVNSSLAYDVEQIKSQLKPEKNNFFKSKAIEVIDGDTLLLDNQITVRLVGIQSPKIALNRKGFKEWPLGYEAKNALSDMVLNKEVTLYYGGRKMDRYGRTLAHLFLNDGTWVQGEMLKNGMARVYSFADNRAIVHEMLSEENEASEKSLGIWGLKFYEIKPQENSGRFTNSFQLISGTVADVATVRSNTYLNFGEDYKTDFTIVVSGRVKKMFEKMDINLANLKGKNIIVRGWLKYYNGPSINLTHPEQLVINIRE